MKRQLQGIALVLFGILLGVSGDSINDMILSSFSDFPFEFFGVCVGIAGLVVAFTKGKDNEAL